MPIDLTEVYGDLHTIDVEARRVAPIEALRHVLESAVQPRPAPPAPVAGDLGDEFVEQFTARRIAFLDDSGPVPLRMVLVPELNENPLPIPAHATFTSATEIDTPTPVAAERSPVTVRKVFGAPSAQTSIARGLLTEGENRSTRDFVAVGESGTTAYWIDIQGEFTRPDGCVHTASFAGDGGIPPEALSASEFSAQLDGSVFRLHGDEERTRVSEVGFGSLTRLHLARTPEGETTVAAEGELRAAESVIPARVLFTCGAARSTLKVTDTASGQTIFTGAAPVERVAFKVLGGLDGPPVGEGAVVLYDRWTWEELRRFPLDGRLSGLTWDGRHLWQARWPSGDLARIDPNASDGDITIVPGPSGGQVAGVASDEGNLILSQCAPSIMPGDGQTYLTTIDPESGRELRRIPRVHLLSSGITAGPDGLVGVANGADQTPISSGCSLLLMDRATAEIREAVLFPRNFFIQDIAREDERSALVTVTEGLSGFQRPSSVYQVTLSAEANG
jgi:hypothetical protein